MVTGGAVPTYGNVGDERGYGNTGWHVQCFSNCKSYCKNDKAIVCVFSLVKNSKGIKKIMFVLDMEFPSFNLLTT